MGGGPYYITQGGSRILNANRVDQSGADDANVVDWTKADAFILAVNINSGGKDTEAAQYKLKWRDVTDEGSFADVDSVGEVKFGSTDLVNGATILVGGRRCDSYGGDAWQNGEEVEGVKLCDSIDLPDEYETEIHFSLSVADGDDGHVYEFELYDDTHGASKGTCGATLRLSGGAEHEKNLSDTINMTDARITNFGLNKADTISLSDSIAKKTSFSKADTINLSDSIVKKPGLNKADTINLSDNISSKGFGLNKSDNITLSDSIVKEFGLSKADTINMSDEISTLLTFLKSLSDTINMSDAITSKAFCLNKADIISLSDSVAKEFGLNKVDTMAMADEVIKAVGLNKADTINMSDAITSKTFGLNKADIISLSDSVAKEFRLSKADTIAMTDEAIKAFGLSLNDSITLSDSLDSAVLIIIAALYNFLAKNKTFNFNAENRVFNFNAKNRVFNFNAKNRVFNFNAEAGG